MVPVAIIPVSTISTTMATILKQIFNQSMITFLLQIKFRNIHWILETNKLMFLDRIITEMITKENYNRTHAASLKPDNIDINRHPVHVGYVPLAFLRNKKKFLLWNAHFNEFVVKRWKEWSRLKKRFRVRLSMWFLNF